MSTELADGLDALAAFTSAVEAHVAAAMDAEADVDNVYYHPDDGVVYVGVHLPEYEVNLSTELGDCSVESDVDLDLAFDLSSGDIDATVNGVTTE